MIQELYIRNFAIIQEQRIEFEPGLNIFSGETGSGKSLVLQALELILGGRAHVKYFRKGCESWNIDASFDLTTVDPSVRGLLPEIAQEDHLSISRSASRNGKTRVLINGHLGSVKMLQSITGRLMNICSQGQQLDLIDATFQRELLDSYGVKRELSESVRAAFEVWREKKKQRDTFADAHSRRTQRRLELEALVTELEPVENLLGRREELENTVKAQQVRAQKAEIAKAAWDILVEDEGILARFHSLRSRVNELGRFGEAVQPLLALVCDQDEVFDELEKSLRRICEGETSDQQALEEVREELAELARLERKYRADGAALKGILKRAREELSELQEEFSLEAIEAELKNSLESLESLAREVSTARKKAAKQLTSEISKGLASLNMAKAKLEVTVLPSDLSESGGDSVVFLFSPNPGEESRELGAIASGGELSRLLLLLKTVLRDRAQVNVLIFDEVDTGISGAVARAVGEKLKSLSANSQVICITHLAQVASFADCHLTVEKEVEGRTTARIRPLQGEERVEEIARMLAGYQVTAAARASARELLTSKSS